MIQDGTQIKWKEIITPNNSLFTLNFRELWTFRDLILLLIKRDITAVYKQTILGPLWFLIQPVLTTVMYVLIFTKVGKFSTGGVPPVLFYLSGLVMWLYFSECILRTASFLKDNNAIFSKVYFPRLIVPIALVLTNLVKLSIHLLLFFLVLLYYSITDQAIRINSTALLFPALIIMSGLLGLSLGIIISSLTTKYKDLIHLVSFGVQLLMFMSPVIYPLSSFENSPLKNLIMANPMTGIIEAFRYAFLGNGHLSYGLLAYDLLCILFFLFIGILLFNSVEKNFVDNV